MVIGLHDSEKEHFKHKTFPNYALMKISAYHKAKGDSVEWWNPAKDYDLVYSSKIFDFTEKNKDLPPDTIKGGTGYDIEKQLPQEIEDMYPHSNIPIGTDKRKIRFRNGYGRTRPSFVAVCTLDIKTGREEWGAEKGKEYYTLKIHEITERSGC